MPAPQVEMPAADMFWGDRYGVVVDPFGHKWSFATHIKDLTPEEMQAGMKTAFGRRHSPMKPRVIVYWIATAITAFVFLSGGA